MATRRTISKKKKKKRAAPEPEVFDPNDPLYYRKLGSHGGKANKKAHAGDDDYFAKLAILSHQKRRENAAAREAASPNGR